MENNPANKTGPAPYQYLGRKTLLIFISERSSPAFIILLVSVLLALLGNKIGNLNIFGFYTLDLKSVALFGFALFATVAAATAFISWLIYENYRFLLDDDSLKIKRGIFNKEEIAIPYRQIQDATIERSFTYQIWGLSRLVILTAGHEDAKDNIGESEGILPALDKGVAEKLQGELLRRANVQKVVGEKQ